MRRDTIIRQNNGQLPLQAIMQRLRRAPDLCICAGFAALAALFYAPLLLGWRAFPSGDLSDHFLPFSLFQQAALLAGRLPLWNPYTFAGHPFLADVQAAIFYPLSNLFLILALPWRDPAARLYWLQVEAMAHIALAGCFTYLLAHELIGERWPAALAGIVFAFSGYLTGYPPLQLAVLRTAIWLPLILWLLRRAFAQPDRLRWWVAAGTAAAVAFLAGHPQTFLHTGYVVAGWIIWQGWTTAAWRRAPGLFLSRVALFSIVAAGLSAAQWLPSLEFMAHSVRAGVDYAFVSGGFPLRDTGQFLLPGVFSTFSPLYIGLIPLGLAGLGVAATTRQHYAISAENRTAETPSETLLSSPDIPSVSRRRSAVRIFQTDEIFFALSALIALLLSYGRNAFLYPIFYRWAPGWALFRDQERAAFIVAFGLSVLAGYGAAALNALSERGQRRFGLGFTAVAAAGLLAVALAARAAGHSANDATLLSKVAAGLIVLVAWALSWRFMPSPAGRRAALIALVAADLFIANYATNLAPVQPQPTTSARAVAAALAGRAPTDGSAPGRVHNDGVLPEDYGMIVGMEEIGGSSPLRLARFAALLGDFPRDRLWQLTGVKYVLSANRQLYTPSRLLAEIPGPHGPAYLHELDAANPRAWVATAIATAADAAALPLLGDAGFDPRTTALLPPALNGVGRPAGLEDGPLGGAGESRVRLERIGPNHLRAHVQSRSGGLLIVSENWLPGWRATVRRPGEAAATVPVVRADLTFLGMPVSPGESTVELVYRPTSVTIGLQISAAVLAALGLALIWRLDTFGLRRRVGALKAAPTRRNPNSSGIINVILLVAFAARAFRLGHQELRGDEALGRLFSLEPFDQIVRSTIALREPHPVASYCVQKVWFALAGHSEFALRFASLWFGVLAVALLYRLGRRLELGRPTAGLAAALLAFSPYAIWHSQDARMYSMSLALTLASTLLMCEALARRRAVWWAGYVAASLLALHTHYYAAYVILAQNLFIFGRALALPAAQRDLRPWLAAQVSTGLLYLPWLIAARAALTGYVGNGDSPGFAAMWVRGLSVFAAGESVPGEQRPFLAVLATALAIIGIVRLTLAGPAGRRSAWLLGLYLFVPLLTTWLGALSRPIFNERYLVAALPGFCLLAAAAVGFKRGDVAQDGILRYVRMIAPALLVGLMALGLLSLARHYDDPIYTKTRGWRTLAAVLARHSLPYAPEKVRVAQNYPDPTLWYYYTGPADHLVLPPAAHNAAGADAEVARLVEQGVERVVVAVQSTAAWDERNIAPTALAKQYALLGETPVAGWWVQVYERPPADLSAHEVAFAAGFQLKESGVPVQHVQGGDLLSIYLRWEAAAGALSGSEKLTLQLLDAQGRLVAQSDRPFTAADLSGQVTRDLLIVPRYLAPGAYRLILALYDPGRPGAPRLSTADGADHIELAVFGP